MQKKKKKKTKKKKKKKNKKKKKKKKEQTVFPSDVERTVAVFSVWAASCGNVLSSICASAQSDQGLHCSLTESWDTEEYIDI